MGFTRDTAKKLYQTGMNFPDGIRQITNKQLWNRVLNKFPRLAEFFLTGQGKNELTTIERSMIEFIKQSDLIKPYRPVSYVENEYAYPPGDAGRPGGSPSDGDHPPVGDDVPPGKPGVALCSANIEGCWCEADTIGQTFVIHGTLPINSIQITFGDASISDDTGYGTNEVTGTIKGGFENVGMVTIEVWMTLPWGGLCDSNVNVFECSDSVCCDTEPECSEANQETIGGNANAKIWFNTGKGPFKYTISGTGFWFDPGFTLTTIENSNYSYVRVYTEASVCGSGTITVEDACRNKGSCVLRSTAGQWGQDVQACNCPGQNDRLTDGLCPGNGAVCTHIEGDCQVRVRYGAVRGCSGYCNCFRDEYCTTCDLAGSNPIYLWGECIPFGPCPAPTSRGTSAGVCCKLECADDDCCEYPLNGFDQAFCYGYFIGYPISQVWECVP